MTLYNKAAAERAFHRLDHEPAKLTDEDFAQIEIIAPERLDQFRVHVPIVTTLAAPVSVVTKSAPVPTRPTTPIDYDKLATTIVNAMKDTIAPIRADLDALKQRVVVMAESSTTRSSATPNGDRLLDGLAAASIKAYEDLFTAADVDPLAAAVMRGDVRQRVAAWKADLREQLAEAGVLTFTDNARPAVH